MTKTKTNSEEFPNLNQNKLNCLLWSNNHEMYLQKVKKSYVSNSDDKRN